MCEILSWLVIFCNSKQTYMRIIFFFFVFFLFLFYMTVLDRLYFTVIYPHSFAALIYCHWLPLLHHPLKAGKKAAGAGQPIEVIKDLLNRSPLQSLDTLQVVNIKSQDKHLGLLSSVVVVMLSRGRPLSSLLSSSKLTSWRWRMKTLQKEVIQNGKREGAEKSARYLRICSHY